MKRILLIDDDFLALNAFFTLADWAQYGLCIAYEAHNAQEALSYLASDRPDIAFIDVCMPDMDGISLLNKIRALDPDILCVMLSSYSDYPYVREAMKHGAKDYLLKHEITRDGILTLLSQNGVDTTPSGEQEDEESRLVKLLTGQEPGAGNLSGMLAYGYRSDDRALVDAQVSSIHQTCRHILNDVPGAVVCSPARGELVIFFSGEAAQGEEHVDTIKKALAKYHNIAYTFLPQRFCADAAQLTRAYELFHRECAQETQASKTSLTSEECMSLMLAVVNHQKELAAKLIHVLYVNAREANDLDGFTRKVLSLYMQLKQLLGIPGEAPKPLPGEPEALEPFFIRMFGDLADHDATGTATPYSHSIDQALDYLHLHYQKDIRLNDVARHCSVSYNHLSFLFKKETGENIISYLNKVRVYHAARLILFDSVPVSQVSEKVGFNCYNHFFSTFRGITGMTPSEFRKDAQAVEWMVKASRGMLRRV